jgi:phosphatidylinositol alpha-mannosyltransferase
MRVCMVVPYDLAEEGGVKRHAMQLAAALRKLGDQVEIVGPCSDARALDEGMHGLSGVVNIPANGSDNRIGVFASPLKVWRLFRERRYDVVHIHEPLQPPLNYYALWNAGAAARIGTFHAFIEDESPGMLRARKMLGAVMFHWYDRGIAVSPAAAECAVVSFKKPLAVIPNGIRTELYVKHTAPVAGAPLRILFVGHWRDSRKGLPHLLDACVKLTERKIAWTLDVVGDGGDGPRSGLPAVRYHGAIRSEPEVAGFYAACDVFVSPATGAESFGIVLLEAMAAARPIVCSDIAGYRHVVGSGPSSGARLVPPRCANSLATALAGLATDPAARVRLGALNRERVRRFEWDQLVARVRGEYLTALKTRGSAARQGVRRDWRSGISEPPVQPSDGGDHHG